MSGRRSAAPRRRTSRGATGALLAVALPVAFALVVVLLGGPAREDPSSRAAQPAAEVVLTAAELSCPGAASDSTAVGTGVASLADPGASGEASVAGSPVDLVPGPVTSVPAAPTATDGTDAVSVRAAAGLAPALLATRSVPSPLAAAGCRPASSVQWFSGVGAAAEHASVLELANDQAGTATAEVTVYSGAGVVDVPALRGVAVEPGTTSRLDLSALVPRRGDLGLRVEVTRGRLGVAVLDREDPLTGAAPSTDWLAPQSEPATRTTLLGLTRGTGSRTLSLVNPGDDEVAVTVSVVTKRATFQPEGLAALTVAPGSLSSAPLDELLAEASRRGAVGLLVESTGPVTSSLRQVTARQDDPDLSLVAPAPALTGPTGVVLAAGRGRLLLAGAEQAGTVSVTSTDAAGAELATREVELAPDSAANLAVPRGAALVRVDPGALAGQVRAAVLLQQPGATVLALSDVRRTSRVPTVRPGLP